MNIDKIPEDKKEKIIEVSVKEFAEKGYDKASTNTIVKESGISKGLLFYYFENKKNLYLYLVDYCLDFVVKRFEKSIEVMSSDFFKRIMEFGLMKIEIANEHPYIYDIVFEAFINIPEPVKIEMEEKYAEISKKTMPIVMSNIDYSMFRCDIDVNKAIEYIFLAFEGIQKKYITRYRGKKEEIINNMDEIMREYDLYIEFMKNGVYKVG